MSDGESMRALMAHSIMEHRWICINVISPNADAFTRSPKEIEKMLTEKGKRLYPAWVLVEIKYFKFENGRYSIAFADHEELPEIETLEQSIEGVRHRLRNWSLN